MNPKLVKFMVEMQNSETKEKESKKEIILSKAYGRFLFDCTKLAKVTIPIDKK